MDKEKSKILVLVEGDKTDYRLMEHLLDVYRISDSHSIVSYHTNIYTLYNEMFRDGDPESNDILQILKEHERDPEIRKLFDLRYSDILLIFDLDPQDPQFTPRKILEMASYFVESSDMGKLYLNYPMVESFYHMKSIPDSEYNSYFATMEELTNKLYKQRVSRENRDRSYSKFAVDKAECDIVIRQNIDKAFWLTETTAAADDDLFVPNSVDILKMQLKLLKDDQLISVLCTCAFYIADYNRLLLTT